MWVKETKHTDGMLPSCSIKENKVIFNAACRKTLGAEKAEVLFHPLKAVLALRTPVDEEDSLSELITEPIDFSHFIPVALESAGLDNGYQYRIYGTEQAENGKSILLFDLRKAQIITKENDYE